VLNAAAAPFKPIEKLFERGLRDLVNTNYLGHVFCIQESIPLLENTEGKVIFISNLGSRLHNPSYPLGSMKVAMESVVRDCSQSLRNQKVMVNGVCEGIVHADAFKTIRLYLKNID
jgi:NAD(P)-dependent dehydrogenase (short-subunit alcohol dehydrogenase family)